jgi:hypothetical protein
MLPGIGLPFVTQRLRHHPPDVLCLYWPSDVEREHAKMLAYQMNLIKESSLSATGLEPLLQTDFLLTAHWRWLCLQTSPLLKANYRCEIMDSWKNGILPAVSVYVCDFKMKKRRRI